MGKNVVLKKNFMKTEQIEIAITLPTSPSILFNAWINSKEHSAFTGDSASCSNQEGGKFLIANEYISGRNLELNYPNRILQSWKTKDFPESAENSFIEVFFTDSTKGCRLKIKHSNIPEGQGEKYKEGWKEFYFKPMKEYYKSLEINEDKII